MDMPFFKSADLLGPLIPAEDATGPVIWLAGGGAGVGLGELLLAGAYAGPGRFHLLRYSKLEQIGESADWAEADVDAVIRQLPPASETSGLLLVGNSVGAHILYEVACRLEKQGRKIARLVLINSVARPRPVDMRDYDYRLYECRSPRKLIRWAQWKLASENRPVLLLWHRVLSILKWAGFAEIAYRSSLILSIAVRLKTFSYRLQHSRYSGELTLFRPSGEGAHPEQDAGWAAYCSEVEVRFFPVSRQRFLQSENRKLLVAELVRLVTESVEAPTESCLAIGKDYSAQARD